MQSHLHSAYTAAIPANFSKKEIFVERRYNVSLLRLAERQRQSGFYNDVTIRVAGRDLGANQLVLGCFSKYFHHLFTSKQKIWDGSEAVVTIDDLDAESVEKLIDFIYSKSIKITQETVCHLLAAADYMQIEEARNYCFEFLLQTMCFENYQIIRDLGKFYKCKDVVNKANDYVRNNSEALLSDFGFINISKDELIEYIKHRDPEKVPHEVIFENAIKWTNHDPEKRTAHFVELFKNIELGEMDIGYLTNVVANEALVMQHLEAQQKCINVMQAHFKRGASIHEKSFLIIGGDSICGTVRKIRTGRAAVTRLKETCTERFNASCTTLKGRVYLLGGQVRQSGTTKATNEVEFLEMQNNIYGESWTRAAPMAKKRFVSGAASINNCLLAVGGANDSGEFLSSCEIFDTSINQWHPIRDMNERRCGHAVVAYQGRVYALGGHNRTKTLETVELFDTRVGSWSVVSSMRTPRRWLAAVATDSTIYAIGGDKIGNKTAPLSTVERFEDRYNSWIEVESMNVQRRGCGACAVGGTIYVVGGANTNATHATVESYVPSAKEWNIELDLGEKILYPCVVPAV